MKSLPICFVASVVFLLGAAQSNNQVHANPPVAARDPAQLAPAAQKPPVSFAEVVPYLSGAPYLSSVAVADVNGDGKPDLLVANQCAVSGPCGGGDTGEATVGVLLGNGDGTFQSVVIYGSGGIAAHAISVADLNGDGKPDIVVANQCADETCSGETPIGVLLGNGDGTFQNAATYDAGGFTGISVAIADVNGDGIPDLLAANEFISYSDCSNGVIGVLLGNGDGTFQPAVTYSSGGYGLQSVTVADVNGDGRPDLVVANFSGPAVGVLLGNGDGTFQPVVTYESGGSTPHAVAVADVNGDGKPDLLVTNQCCEIGTGNGTVGVLLGNGDGTFQSAITYGAGGVGSYSTAVADLNGDGVLDLVVASESCNKKNKKECGRNGAVGVLLGNGDGTFQPAVAFGSGGSVAWSVAVADVNGDGKLDVAVANDWNGGDGTVGAVGVLLNNFIAPTTVKITSTPNPSTVNQVVSFSATVTSNPSIPDGEVVTFYDGKTVLGTGATTNGVASFTESFSKAKTYTIKAAYSGDSYHEASSGNVKQVVNP